MDEVEEVKKNVEELKEEGRQEAREIAKKVAAAIPEGMTLRRIREHNYHNCFVIEMEEETLVKRLWDGSTEKIREEIEKMVQKAISNIKQREKEEELQKIYPLPPEPVVEKPVPVEQESEPVVEKTEIEKEIEGLEQRKTREKEALDLASELGLILQVELRDASIRKILEKIDILRHGGKITYRDVREWEEYGDGYEEYEEETGEWVGEWEEYALEKYTREIPLYILKELEKRMQEAFFDSYEIWEKASDPVVIGVKGDYVAELARWR